MAKKNKKAWKKQQRLLQQMMAANGAAAAPAPGLLGGLGQFLPSRRSDQFLVGLAVGAAAAYVLADEELRGKLIKSGLKLYGSLVGGLAEMKEQVADLQAELQAEQAEGL